MLTTSQKWNMNNEIVCEIKRLKRDLDDLDDAESFNEIENVLFRIQELGNRISSISNNYMVQNNQ